MNVKLKRESVGIIHRLQRWRLSGRALFQELELAKREIESLRAQVLKLTSAKEHSEHLAEERRQEKESLRVKLANQKKATDSATRQVEMLSEKIIELKAEIDTQAP